MFKKAMAGTTLVLLMASLTSPALAAARITLADQAIVNTKCIEANKISLAKTGPLICSKAIWKNVIASQDSVATRAYRSLLARYNRMPDVAPNLIVRADPKAGDWKNKIVKGFVAAARLWGTSTSEDPALPLYISESAEYISENLTKDGLRENPEDAERNRNAVINGRSQAGAHGPYFDFIFSDQNAHDMGFYQVGPHEYTHHAQRIFSNSRAAQLPREFWIEEGCATFVGTSMGGLINLPQNQREQIVSNLRTQGISSQLMDFSRGTPAAYSNPNFGNVYNSGAIACEALVAVAGIDSLESLYRGVATEGNTFESASMAVYGMSLDSIVKFGQIYLDSVRKGKELSLSELNKKYKSFQGS